MTGQIIIYFNELKEISGELFEYWYAPMGGAICNYGTTSVKTSVFRNNSASYWGGAIANQSAYNEIAKLDISDSTFYENHTSTGSAIYNSGYYPAILNVSGSTFSSNRADYDGGAIDTGGTATITGSTFCSNNAGSSGAIDNSGTATIIGSTFCRNCASHYGGALCSSGTVTITESIFSSNYSGSGGAISNIGAAIITGSTFCSNTTSYAGGVIYNNDFYGGSATIDISGSTFRSNRSDDGGVLHNIGNDSKIMITGSMFSENIAANGGVIDNDCTVDISSSMFHNNSACCWGGVIYNSGWDSQVIITGAIFCGNSAHAGGVIDNNCTVDISSSTFSGNSAYRGGAFYSYGTATIRGSTFSGNRAYRGGAIFNINYLSTTTICQSTFSGNLSENGGGAIFNAATLVLDQVTLQQDSDIIDNYSNVVIRGQLFFSATSGNSYLLHSYKKLSFDTSLQSGDKSIDQALIADWSRVDNQCGVLINAETNVRNGEFLLAQNVGSFDSKVIKLFADWSNKGYDRGYVLDLNESFVWKNWTYQVKNGSDLIYSVKNAHGTPDTKIQMYIDNGQDATLDIQQKNFKKLYGNLGGAIINDGSITIQDSFFTDNIAGEEGGALCNGYQNHDAWTQVTRSSFINNTVLGKYFDQDLFNIDSKGGAIFNAKSIEIAQSNFNQNAANAGGAIYNNGNLKIVKSTFAGNTANYYGGAFYGGAGLGSIIDTVFSGNTAQKGGAIYIQQHFFHDNKPNYSFANLTFSNNLAESGGAIYNLGGEIQLDRITLTQANDTIYNGNYLDRYYDIVHCQYPNEGTWVYGKLNISGKLDLGSGGSCPMLLNDKDAVLNFDVSAMSEQTPDGTALINNWNLVENRGNITITVGDNQANGVYKLANNAANFDFSVTVKNIAGTELGIFSMAQNRFMVNGEKYQLNYGKELDLIVGSNQPPKPAKFAASDIDGNGTSDVVFQYTGGDNQLGFWMNGTADWKGGNPPEPQTWEVIGAYDMDNSGKADVVMLGNIEVNGVKGAYVGYRKDGDMTTWENIDYLTNPDGIDWKLKVGNVTGNAGKNSLVWHAAELGAVGVWLDGTSEWKAIDGYFDKSWTLLGTGDFSGDGKDEILFQNGDGFYTVDIDSNFRELGHTGTGWTMRAIGDYSGDGKDDLVFFHQETGSVMMYQDGTTFKNMGQLDAKDWFIVGAGDYNGDQQDDLLVRQYSTGMLGYYASGDLAQWVEMGRGVDMNWMVIA